MRLVYLGTPEAAVPPLRALVAAGHEVALVVSQPDRKRGRGGTLVPTPVKEAAIELGLPVTDRVDDALVLHRAKPVGLGVVVAFGQLIKPHVLAELDFVNIHFSLLPRWRGAAPVERALLAGDSETGCCLMALEEGLDTGPVYRRVTTPIHANESADQLRARLVDIGTAMLVTALAEGLGEAVVQAGEVTHAAKLTPGEFVIDWSQSAEAVNRVVRLGSAHTMFKGKRLKVLKAHVVDSGAGVPGELHGEIVTTLGDGLCLEVVQPEGKQPMSAADWLRGSRIAPGERLGMTGAKS